MNPILADFPEEFETKRLLIRSPRFGDGSQVNEAVVESFDELKPWMPWAQQLPTIEESEEGVRRARLKFLERTDLRLILLHKETGEFIGSSGLHRIDWQAGKFEIGYWIRTAWSGQGFMTEAVDGITNFAIDQLKANRIEIRCDSRNNRSARIAERLGFKLEGILRCDTRDISSGLRDTKVFAKVRGEEF